MEKKMLLTVITFILPFCSQAITDEKKIDPITKEEQTRFGNYIVPSPHELFGALENLNKQTWAPLTKYIKDDQDKHKVNYTNPNTISMNMGIRVADGFIGVVAEDTDLIFMMGRDIKLFATRLGVRDSLLTMTDEVEILAQKKDWKSMVTTLNGIQEKILEEMTRLGDKDGSTLGSYAGWLEGLHLLSKSLLENYNSEASQILRQPGLIDRLIIDLNSLSKESKGEEVVSEIITKTPLIRKLVDVPPGQPIPLESVKELYSISSVLVNHIQRSK